LQRGKTVHAIVKVHYDAAGDCEVANEGYG